MWDVILHSSSSQGNYSFFFASPCQLSTHNIFSQIDAYNFSMLGISWRETKFVITQPSQLWRILHFCSVSTDGDTHYVSFVIAIHSHVLSPFHVETQTMCEYSSAKCCLISKKLPVFCWRLRIPTQGFVQISRMVFQHFGLPNTYYNILQHVFVLSSSI